MIDVLALAVTLACTVVALTALVRVAGRRYRWTRVAPALALLQAVLVVQAVLDVLSLATGHRPRELGTHLAYLVVSVLVLPVVAVQVRDDDGAWAGGLVAAGLLAVAVIVIRMQTTWRTGHA